MIILNRIRIEKYADYVKQKSVFWFLFSSAAHVVTHQIYLEIPCWEPLKKLILELSGLGKL